MRLRAAERLYKRKVRDHAKWLVGRADDRPQLERQRIFLSRAPHVVELNIAAELHRPFEGLRNAEVNLRARTRVFVISVRELRRGEILADLEPAQDAIGGLERLVYLMHIHLALRQLSGRGRGRIGMEFERQMTDRRGVGIVNLDFVEVDRVRWARGRQHREDAHRERENIMGKFRHARHAGNSRRDSLNLVSSADSRTIADQPMSARPLS